jgi:hypothetical protein
MRCKENQRLLERLQPLDKEVKVYKGSKLALSNNHYSCSVKHEQSKYLEKVLHLILPVEQTPFVEERADRVCIKAIIIGDTPLSVNWSQPKHFSEPCIVLRQFLGIK